MRITFCGTQSCGKTTLVNEVRKHMRFKRYKIFTERSKYLKSIGIPLNQQTTFNGQLVFMAERAKELIEENMITDRSSLDVAAFTEASCNIEPKHKTLITFLLLEMAKQYDYIFYIPPTIQMEDNGIRETDLEYRKVIDDYIKQLLKHPYVVNKVYKIKNKTIEGRINEILKTIREDKVR